MLFSLQGKYHEIVYAYSLVDCMHILCMYITFGLNLKVGTSKILFKKMFLLLLHIHVILTYKYRSLLFIHLE